MLRALEFAAGVLIAALTLRDVFDTVVVPGQARGLLRIAPRVLLGALGLWRRTRHGPIGLGFAPFMLLVAFVVWMLLLVLAFGLMAYALRDAFVPALDSFGQALYVAGGAMTTIGFGSIDPTGWARAVEVGAGFCGLAVVTLAVTYLLTVQGNVALRDTAVLKFSATAGEPSSGAALLERYAALGCRDALPQVLEEGREWCAATLQSHAAHPSLIYFRSAGTEAGWPAMLGALLDSALIGEMLLDEPAARAPAVLLRQQANRLAEDLVALIDLQPEPAATTPGDVTRLLERLRDAGYRLQEAPDLEGFADARAIEAGRIAALADHLGTPAAPLLPAAS